MRAGSRGRTVSRMLCQFAVVAVVAVFVAVVAVVAVFVAVFVAVEPQTDVTGEHAVASWQGGCLLAVCCYR